MKTFLVLFLLLLRYSLLPNQTSLGILKTVNQNLAEIARYAQTVLGYDIIAIQVGRLWRCQAVAKLADELNRTGTKWDYVISEPTSSSAYKTERYAFIWKTSKLKIGSAWLEKKTMKSTESLILHIQSGKTVYRCKFSCDNQKMQPETEIKYFKFFLMNTLSKF
jgi:hypothetical protein